MTVKNTKNNISSAREKMLTCFFDAIGGEIDRYKENTITDQVEYTDDMFNVVKLFISLQNMIDNAIADGLLSELEEFNNMFDENGNYHVSRSLYKKFSDIEASGDLAIVSLIKSIRECIKNIVDPNTRHRIFEVAREACDVNSRIAARERRIEKTVDEGRKKLVRLAFDIVNEFNGIIDKTVLCDILHKRVLALPGDDSIIKALTFRGCSDKDGINSAINEMCRTWTLEFHNLIMTHKGYARIAKIFTKIFSAKMAMAFGVDLDIGMNNLPEQWKDM